MSRGARRALDTAARVQKLSAFIGQSRFGADDLLKVLTEERKGTYAQQEDAAFERLIRGYEEQSTEVWVSLIKRVTTAGTNYVTDQHPTTDEDALCYEHRACRSIPAFSLEG